MSENVFKGWVSWPAHKNHRIRIWIDSCYIVYKPDTSVASLPNWLYWTWQAIANRSVLRTRSTTNT